MKSDIRHVNTVLNVDVCHFAICIIVYVANVSSACTSSMSTTDCIAGYTVVLLDIIDPTVSLCHAVIKNNNNHFKKTTTRSYSGAHCKRHHFLNYSFICAYALLLQQWKNATHVKREAWNDANSR